MASGGRGNGFSLSKLPPSDPRPSRGWQRSSTNSDDQNDAERDVNSSHKNVPKEVRINNWDFADWRPNSASTDSKRRKKSKGNPEREREQSLSLDSPPQRDKKPRTPSTFPRTKIGPATPTSQKRALENLRSRMTFSETDDASTDGEPNNERGLPVNRKHPPPNYTRQDTLTTLEGATPNRNNNREESISDLDSNQIVGRLMQIRDYIKQANTMRETLHKSKEATNKDDMDKLKKLVDNLKEQEGGYMGLLQRMLALRDDSIVENGNGFLHAVLPDEEDDVDIKSQSDDTVSVDLEVQTNASDTTTEERTNSSSSRPYIEDKLGDTEEEEEEGVGRGGQRSKESTNMDNTLVAQRNTQTAEWDFGTDVLQSEEVPTPSQIDSMRTNELAALQQQQNLLKILAEKQEQLRALQGRQDALKAMHQEAEQKLAIAQTKENKAKSSILAVSDVVRRVNNSQSGDGPVDSTTAASQMEQLMSLRNRLEMLKNASVQLDEEEERSNHDNETSVDDDAGRRQLQDKLEDLQSKKDRMDDLLKELQALRSQRFEALLQGEGEDVVTAAPVVSGQVIESLEQVDGTADSTEQVLSMMDAHNKLEKLQEVKQRLDQLRGLVQYYQSAKHDGESVDCVDQSSVPGYSDYGEGEATDNAQRVAMETMYQSVVGPQTRLNPLGAVCDPPAPPLAPPQQSDEENASSNNGSQGSSLGPWGDEPEIREKVRQLKATKEKLQQLQDLVAMVQESPEVVPSLPDNVGVGEEEGDVRNIPVPLVEVPTHDNPSEKSGIVGGESLLTVKDQIKELSELKEERERLLHIQNQLKSLHSHFDGEEEGEEREERERKKRGSSEPGPVVTFASNDELYSKMRKQRMLREELRSKKKELEAIMKKDRNKRQYFKNQDNQSDTVSYSTDAFGASASADVTMATWGGSTVDNLENITESRNGGEEEEEYLSDGIVQVEEEEEEDSDNNTYTIEGDAKQRQASRNKPSSSSSLDVRPKVRKPDSFPRSHAARDDVNRGPRVKVEKKEMVRKTRLQKKSRQQNYRSPEDIVRDEETTDSSRLDTIQQQLERTLELLQHSQTNPLHQPATSPNTSGLSGNVRPGIYPTDLIQQQIQQQQMMMSMNHFHQQLSLQQLEMRTLQQNIHQINQYIINSSPPPTTTDINPLASSSSIPLSPSQNPFPSLTPPSSSFNFNPRFPPSFSQSNTRPADLDSALRSPSRPDTSRNNLRPVPSSRVDSYDQNTNLNNYLSRERDVRPKVQDHRRSRRAKESQSSSPRDDIERGGERRGRERFDDSSLGGAFTSRINRNRGNDGSEMSLFETLRETIYAEVATLISRNESRPHFLLEIIRELQNLSTDYLRQRGLYTLQELVAKTLSTDDPSYTVMATRWTKTDKDNLTASDLTPSESCLTSDDEEVRGRMEKTKKLEHQGSLKNNEFDYTEQVENTSSLSTPSTGLMESPFANESLGDTVIHLDKALERMRQMERNDEDGGGGGQINPQSIEIVYNRVREARQAARSCDHPSTSCLSDQSSPYTTVPDLTYGRVNSKHLDVEVKQIITEVVPVIREHVDDVCSPQLLSYVKRLILSLTRQRDSRKQFTPFFHQQLGSILHDSLTRFEGRKVRECSDDLLNDMSDALYDELAFFRMMQDLNQPPANVKTAKIKTSSPHHSPVNHRKQPINEDNNSSDDGHQLNIETTGEDDDLGKERDDELASETIQDGDDKDQETESPYKTSAMKIELAVSETKPFTRIGSDEDDEDSDESHSAEDPSETAVSRDAKMSQSQDAPRPTSEGVATSTSPLKPDADKDEEEEEEKKDGDDEHPAAVVNGDKDDEEVKIDDLPTSLNIHTTKDIKEKMREEELSTGGVASVLSIIDVPVELAGDGNHLPNPDEFGK